MEKAKIIEDLPGVGPNTAEKLKNAGYTTIEAIAVAPPSELASNAGITESAAAKMTRMARELADIGGFETGDVVYERRKLVGKLTTGSSLLDALLGGGVESQAITEFHGEFGSGKTQIAHQLCVNVQLPKEMGGLDGSAIIIDTENTFRPERIAQMVNGLKIKYGETNPDISFDAAEFLKNIHVARAYNSNHQMLLVDSAKQLAESLKDGEKPVRLMVVDSLTAQFRSEYIGRGTLASRQGKLNRHLRDLLNFARDYEAVIVVSNQMMSKPDVFYGDPNKPIGGHVLAHTVTYRLLLKRSKDNTRIVRLIDSPALPDGEVVISVTENGIED
ncbi:MAG: DNA repair and recombination protein RadA [Methermicoccaceae archaeon]